MTLVDGRDAEIDRLRRLPGDVVEALRDDRLFSLLVEERLGGLEADLPVALRVIEDLATVSASVAWVLTIGMTTAYWATALVDDKTCAIVHPKADPSVITGTAGPAGMATKGSGGWRITGRWSFASGSAHSDWVAVGCRLFDEGAPVMGPGGIPRFASFLVPTERVHIEDTWHVTGLRGTASNDYVIEPEDDVVVEESMSFNHLTDPPRRPGRRYSYLGLAHALLPAVSVGIARAAVGDAVTICREKKDRYGGPSTSTQPAAQFELGSAAAKADAAACLLHSAVDEAWVAAEEGFPGGPVRARVRAACTFAVQAATEATTHARSAVGSSGIYESCALEQRFRDASTAATQLGHRPFTYADAGSLLTGTYESPLAIF